MKIHIPNSAWLGNIDKFLSSFDESESDKLTITANKQWISIHPVALSMVAALGLSCKPENIACEPIRYVMSELMRNVFEHAESKIGAIVCAQYFSKTNRISIGIVDRGVGIKETISQSYAVKSHSEAIRLALTPGITGTTKRIGGTDYNAGAGLF